MPLCLLPPELLKLVLSSCESPRDLYAFISASPLCLQVFLQSPGRILIAVVVRCIPPSAFIHAAAVVKVPKIGKGPSAETWKSRLFTFLGDYFRHAIQDDDGSFDDAQARDFAKLYARTCRFVDDMTGTYLDLLYGAEITQLHDAISQPSLSYTERTRVERAFYRYELYSRCFPVDPQWPVDALIPAQEQYDEFIRRLPAWQVEEMSCVHQYFETKLGRMVDEFEREIIAKVQSHAVSKTTRKDNLDDGGLCVYKAAELRGLDLFSEPGHRQKRFTLGYMASLGMGVLFNIIFPASPEAQRHLFQAHVWGGREFLPEALDSVINDESPPHHEDVGEEEDPEETVQNNDPNQANEGWRRFRKPDEDYYLVVSSPYIPHWPTRRLGCVFWDRERIADPRVGSKLREACKMDDNEIKVKFGSWKGRSNTEERLEGIWFPESIMEEIVRDYGSTFDIMPPLNG